MQLIVHFESRKSVLLKGQKRYLFFTVSYFQGDKLGFQGVLFLFKVLPYADGGRSEHS